LIERGGGNKNLGGKGGKSKRSNGSPGFGIREKKKQKKRVKVQNGKIHRGTNQENRSPQEKRRRYGTKEKSHQRRIGQRRERTLRGTEIAGKKGVEKFPKRLQKGGTKATKGGPERRQNDLWEWLTGLSEKKGNVNRNLSAEAKT